jgi:hypothetical protein
MIAADPHPGSTLHRAIVQNVTVTIGNETNVGAVVLP